MMLALGGQGTSSQTFLACRESNSSCSALAHSAANGDFIAALCVSGSEGVECNTLMWPYKFDRYG